LPRDAIPWDEIAFDPPVRGKRAVSPSVERVHLVGEVFWAVDRSPDEQTVPDQRRGVGTVVLSAVAL